MGWPRLLSGRRVRTGLGKDIFEIQEDIARLIVKSVGGHLIRAATDFAFHTPTDNLDAWGRSARPITFGTINSAWKGPHRD